MLTAVGVTIAVVSPMAGLKLFGALVGSAVVAGVVNVVKSKMEIAHDNAAPGNALESVKKKLKKARDDIQAGRPFSLSFTPKQREASIAFEQTEEYKQNWAPPSDPETDQFFQSLTAALSRNGAPEPQG